MPAIAIASPDDPRLAPFRDVGDAELRRRDGLFLAEGRLVVERLLTGGRWRVRGVLVTGAAHAALRDTFDECDPSLAVYVVPQDWMRPITGFNLHRGCLAAGERGAGREWREVSSGRLTLALEGIGNPDNVGGLFRTAHACGVEGVLLGPGTGDPLYRKAIRVSCGGALAVPFADAVPLVPVLSALREEGVAVWALTPSAAAVPIARACAAGVPSRLVLLLGSEGDGLTREAQAAASRLVRVPIVAAADSLNVTVAAGIALAYVTEARLAP